LTLTSSCSEPADRVGEPDEPATEPRDQLWGEPADWLSGPADSADRPEELTVQLAGPAGRLPDEPVVPPGEPAERTVEPAEPRVEQGESVIGGGLGDATRRHNLDISLLARHIGRDSRIVLFTFEI
jgi:hypothetical protein